MKNELEAIPHSKMSSLNFLLVDISYRKPHLHFEMELAYVIEGTGTIKTQETSYSVQKGQAILFNSFQLHEIISDKSLRLLIIQFDTTVFESIMPQLGTIYFDSKPFYLKEYRNLFYNILYSTISYFEKESYSPLRVHGFVSLVLDYLLKICDYSVLNTAQQNKLMDLQERIQRIASYIHEHYSSKISLDDLASREGFSRTYFSHFFKNNFGMTFKEYLDNIRCEKAKGLLNTTSENLLTVSYLCGFSDIRTLNNAFEKRYGLLPKDYRRSEDAIKEIDTSSYNQDEIDNQKLYTDEEALDLLYEYFEEYFDPSFINL